MSSPGLAAARRRRLGLLTLIATLVAAFELPAAHAAPAAFLEYRVDLSARATGRVTVTLEIGAAPASLVLVFPAWLPGAYELRYFGREVRSLEATSAGRSLLARRASLTRFVVEGHTAGARVLIRYEIAAALFSDDGAELSRAHAYLNPGAVLPLVLGQERVPHSLIVQGLPPSWRIVAALPGDPRSGLVAPSYETLIDGPIEAAPTEALASSTRRLEGAEFTIAVHDDGHARTPPPPAALWADLARLVAAERRLAGALPYDRYLLLIHLSDRPEHAVALEHASSTSVLARRGGLEGEGYLELRQMIAHELFHAWNARRLVPAAYTRWDPEAAQASSDLWITEGLTEHAALVARAGAGLDGATAIGQALSLALTRARRAERSGLSLEAMSQLAFASPSSTKEDPDAYYAVGHVISLALTAELLRRSEGRLGLRELLATLLPPPGAQPRAIDRAGLGRSLDELLARDGAAPSAAAASVASRPLSSILDHWVGEAFSLAEVLPSLTALGLRVSTRSDERGDPIVLVDPASLRGDAPASLRPLRARLLGLLP